MDIILIAGLWLRRSIWAHVATELEQLGHRPIPLALPGVDDASTGATLAAPRSVQTSRGPGRW